MAEPIFISYARKDATDFAKHLHNLLESDGIYAWLDTREIATGELWDEEVWTAIDSCCVFAYIITPGSRDSKVCGQEYERAKKAGKTIAPILLLPTEPLPIYLPANKQYIDYIKDGERTTFAKLCLIRDAFYFPPQSPDAIRAAETKATAATLARPAAKDFGTARTRKPNPFPPRSIADFRDRAKPRADINTHLANGARLISIYGQGGVGKTAMVVEVLTELEKSANPPDLIVALRETRPNAKDLADRGISVERIFLDIARALGGQERDEIESIWTARAELPQRTEALIRALGTRRCLVLLDNMEVLQDPATGALTDPDLLMFLGAALPISETLQVLLTSRERLQLPRELRLYEKLVPLSDGLPPDDAIEMVTALDDDGRDRIKNAPRKLLMPLVERVKSYPRALEYLAALLKDDPRLTPEKLLNNPALLQAEVTHALAAEAFRRLPPDSVRVLEGLALYGRPATLPALEYLLAPYLDPPRIDSILLRLMESYFVAYNPATDTYTLHPLDLEYAKGRIPPGTPDDRTAEPPPYTRVALLGQAVAYFRSIRISNEEIKRRKTIEALDPQLTEFDYLVALEDFDGAADLLTDTGFDYLLRWGYARRVVELHTRIADKIADKKLRGICLCRLGVAYDSLGKEKEAQSFIKEALTIARDVHDRPGEGTALGSLGNVYYSLGQFERAINFYNQQLVIVDEIKDDQGKANVCNNMGLVYADSDQVERAISFYDQALNIAHDIGYRKGKGDALGNLGRAYAALEQVERAISFYDQALVIDREIGDREGEGTDLDNEGVAYEKLEQFDEALLLFRQALIIRKEIGNPELIAETERNIQRVFEKNAKDTSTNDH